MPFLFIKITNNLFNNIFLIMYINNVIFICEININIFFSNSRDLVAIASSTSPKAEGPKMWVTRG